MKFDLVLRKLRTIFRTCDVRLMVCKVRESNQADHVIGHLEQENLSITLSYLDARWFLVFMALLLKHGVSFSISVTENCFHWVTYPIFLELIENSEFSRLMSCFVATYGTIGLDKKNFSA